MKSLVGNTGFVGSNIAASHTFNAQYNSKNITSAYNTRPDLLVYAGVKAEKYLANSDAAADFKTIEGAIHNIKEINPKKIVLISTIDIYQQPYHVNEDTIIESDKLQPYGLNRYYLEKWVQKNFDDCLIVRLPGLYGKNIKKNFIFDMINIIPTMLNEIKFNELIKKSTLIRQCYIPEKNGFFKCVPLSASIREKVKNEFLSIGFSALNFTDSRGVFQFYNLAYLWNHIEVAIKNNIKILNIAVEPVKVSDLYRYIYQKEFKNEISKNILKYDFKTKYAAVFKGNNGYLFSKEFIFEDIKNFVEDQS